MPRAGATTARSAGGPERERQAPDHRRDPSTASTPLPRSSARASVSPHLDAAPACGIRDRRSRHGAAGLHRAAGPLAGPARHAAIARQMVDRIVTFALLAYGLVNVVTAIPALIDYGAYADTVFNLSSVDVELPTRRRAAVGIAAAIVLAVGWLMTARAVVVELRRGRLTWWIPLVGGASSSPSPRACSCSCRSCRTRRRGTRC